MGRYENRWQYFNELAYTSREYYLDYLKDYITVDERLDVLEIGCGEGGNLLPFAQAGCRVTGLDLAEGKIENARIFFDRTDAEGTFLCENFLEPSSISGRKYDLILVHDVIEHIEPEGKNLFIAKMSDFLKEGGVIFFGFPAWQMPYGGHQQICRHRMAKLPWIHLLPRSLYGKWLKAAGESESTINELQSIKRSKMTPGRFESLCRDNGYKVLNRQLWLINPHYKVKFHLRPMRLPGFLSCIPGLRNWLSTSCFYILTR